MRFEAPIWFAAVAVLLLGAFLVRLARRKGSRVNPSVLFSNVDAIEKMKPTWRTRGVKLLVVADVIALILLVVALARPQKGRSDSEVTTEGIDIVLVVDTSSSMAAEDFGGDKTRLAHVVEVMKDFIDKRTSDRIGIVSFATHAYTRCPMTLDYGLLDDIGDYIHQEWQRAYDGMSKKFALEGQNARLTPSERDISGTAIGDGLVAAMARLENSKAKSKVIVLLTDGEQTAGEAEPSASAELAKSLGIKVYTIGAGSNGVVPVRTFDRFRGWVRRMTDQFRIDDRVLKEIAETTGGRYFAARDRQSLEDGYAEISRLERSEIKVKDYREWDERFEPLAYAALCLLFLHAALANTILRTIP